MAKSQKSQDGEELSVASSQKLQDGGETSVVSSQILQDGEELSAASSQKSQDGVDALSQKPMSQESQDGLYICKNYKISSLNKSVYLTEDVEKDNDEETDETQKGSLAYFNRQLEVSYFTDYAPDALPLVLWMAKELTFAWQKYPERQKLLEQADSGSAMGFIDHLATKQKSLAKARNVDAYLRAALLNYLEEEALRFDLFSQQLQNPFIPRPKLERPAPNGGSSYSLGDVNQLMELRVS